MKNVNPQHLIVSLPWNASAKNFIRFFRGRMMYLADKITRATEDELPVNSFWQLELNAVEWMLSAVQGGALLDDLAEPYVPKKNPATGERPDKHRINFLKKAKAQHENA